MISAASVLQIAVPRGSAESGKLGARVTTLHRASATSEVVLVTSCSAFLLVLTLKVLAQERGQIEDQISR